ncbi:MAG TPA: hypothetical protein VF544_07945 [Pyrinomonadaceae bacterium]|jgi:hypothetical protein
MRLKLQSLLLTALVCLAGTIYFQARAQQAGASSITSVYTSISGRSCRTIDRVKETGDVTQLCPGVGGYRLEVADSDSRMSVTVVAPSGKKSDLEYWNVITHGFSSLGEKAEWRVQKKNGRDVPIALIVRVNASENPEAPDKITSYLAVAKVTPQQSCVTDKIAPSATANEEARRAADSSAQKPCLAASQE